MEITVITGISMLCLLTLPVIVQRVHPFEAFLVWGWVLFMHSNYMWLIGMNGELFALPKLMRAVVAHALAVQIIFPAIALHCIRYGTDASSGRANHPLLLAVAAVALLAGFEQLEVLLGVVDLKAKWHWGYSLGYWCVFALSAYGVWRVSRRLARKEVEA
ncbi:hypothetical protein [Paenibacillus methanolicus]|uniref:Uncharacterized protein n=1 Tax=Paenibacillus methanolicus TaxID=582686 RepID=A0A5S5CBA5_9BACL|nr:hypothetical protein [Paenibacillus methanolicus]TYP75626.1 hypothetical protein BCM02_104306 [Paenibacillus methanolicus]